MTDSKTKKLTTAEFDDATKEGVTLVDFYADWCGPCKALAPTLDELANKFEGKVTVAKVDVDSEAELAQRFGVQSIPTIVAIKAGEEVDRIHGNVPMEKLEALIDRASA